MSDKWTDDARQRLYDAMDDDEKKEANEKYAKLHARLSFVVTKLAEAVGRYRATCNAKDESLN